MLPKFGNRKFHWAPLWEDAVYGVDNPRQRYIITVEVLAAALTAEYEQLTHMLRGDVRTKLCKEFVELKNAINLAKQAGDGNTSVVPYSAEFRLKDHLLLLAKELGLNFDPADFPPAMADILTRRGIPLTF